MQQKNSIYTYLDVFMRTSSDKREEYFEQFIQPKLEIMLEDIHPADYAELFTHLQEYLNEDVFSGAEQLQDLLEYADMDILLEYDQEMERQLEEYLQQMQQRMDRAAEAQNQAEFSHGDNNEYDDLPKYAGMTDRETFRVYRDKRSAKPDSELHSRSHSLNKKYRDKKRKAARRRPM